MSKPFQNGGPAPALRSSSFLQDPNRRLHRAISRTSRETSPIVSGERTTGSGKRSLRVMKFGGTSVADAYSIQKVAAIIKEAISEADVAVVVSAMAGVTDALLDAIAAAEAGHRYRVALILDRLRSKYMDAATALIGSPENRCVVARRIDHVFTSGGRFCEQVIVSRKATPAQSDAICGLGERASAPLVAAALVERGVSSEAIQATELIVTDGNHGAAEPVMNRTREQCMRRLRPLLDRAIVPVVTGFIGATAEGRLTTLGRGGSDYSATIVASALDADEIIIWTDVDGLMTADPRSVPATRVIAEISYREAAELASFGAKVLHPKTLGAITESGIPVWIRNTLAPHLPGTRITPKGPRSLSGVRSLTSTTKVAAITISGNVGAASRGVATRAIRVATRVSRRLFLVTSSREQVGFVLDSESAEAAVQQLEREFESEIQSGELEDIRIESKIGLVTAVGSKLTNVAAMAQKTIEDAGVDVLLSSSEAHGCSLSFAVNADGITRAVTALHRTFVLSEAPAIQAGHHRHLPELEAYSAD